MIELNEDQKQALSEIIEAFQPGRWWLLTGHAGSGKTTLLCEIVRYFEGQRRTIAVVAPTHKAVAVLDRKLAAAGVWCATSTIHRLLGLRAVIRGDKQVFEAEWGAGGLVMPEIIVVDEASMVNRELIDLLIDNVPWAFVLFIGDPAQLPPVGEAAAAVFSMRWHSHLRTIVRQAEGNPIIRAADIVRKAQDGVEDWSWVKHDLVDGKGLRMLQGSPAWHLREMFLSPSFEADPDFVRYAAYTNAQVKRVNDMVRLWRYGKTETPFVPGERFMASQRPVTVPSVSPKGYATTETVLQNGSEAVVEDIREARIYANFRYLPDPIDIPAWEIAFKGLNGPARTRIPKDPADLERALGALKAKAAWRDFYDLRDAVPDLRPIYALTTHATQGSTFTHVFLDVQNIARPRQTPRREVMQLCYVGLTRPTDSVLLWG